MNDDGSITPRGPACLPSTLVGGMSAARGTPGSSGHTSGALPIGVYGPKAALEKATPMQREFSPAPVTSAA
jgi:hypothetical protein